MFGWWERDMVRVMNIRRQAVSAAVACGLAASALALAAEVAQASIPDQWGFAFVNKPSVPGIPDVNHQAGSWVPPFKVHVTPGGVGQVFVTFPHIAGKGGVVHVTAVSPNPVWCQAQKWVPSGVNEVVAVRCYRPGGAPVFVPFSITFTRSSKGPIPPGRAFGYVHFEPGAGLVTTFNSAGAANHVAAGGVGVWNVVLPGLGSPAQAGNVQVTAVNAAKPAKCEVGGWAPKPAQQVFQIRCYNASVAPLATGWTLTYHRGRTVLGTQPKRFAYTFDNQPLLAGPYAPAPPTVNFNSASGVNSVRTAGVGLRLVTFPRVGVLPNNVLVTPFKVGPGFCNLLAPWATSVAAPQVIVRDVACYSGAGKLASRASFVTYASRT
jgi:hypothetical protein